MQILLDDNKISEYFFIEDGMNSLGYESLNEVFFDVYQIKCKEVELVKEKKGDFNGNPIIEADLKIKDKIFKNVRFVLSKENNIKINPKLLDYTKVTVYENTNNKPQILKPVNKKSNKLTKPIVLEKIKKESKSILVEQNLIEKTKADFLKTIKNEVLEQIKNEIKEGVILDLIKNNLQNNFNSVIDESSNKNKLHQILEKFNNSFRKEYIDLAEKVSKREALRYVESGGGTNAVQYKNGGTIDGELIINGNLIVNNQTYIKKIVFDVGDGINQSFTFMHNLNTKNILVNVQDNNTNEIVIPYIKILDLNSLVIEFSFVPDINNYKLIILG